MLKNLPWKTVLLTLLAWMLFWEIKETISGERHFFLVRWVFSEMSSANNIEVLTYTLTDEHVAYMLTHPDEEVKQPTQNDLFSKKVNAVFRIRNLNGGVASGRLLWTISGNGWSAVDVNDIPGKGTPKKGNFKKYGDIIIAVGIFAGIPKDTLPESIKVKWDALYVYR